MKKLLFATALLTALFLSACGSQKADSNDLANQPATRPEEGAELDPEFSVDGEDTGETAEPQPDAELSEMVDAIQCRGPTTPATPCDATGLGCFPFA